MGKGCDALGGCAGNGTVMRAVAIQETGLLCIGWVCRKRGL